MKELSNLCNLSVNNPKLLGKRYWNWEKHHVNRKKKNVHLVGKKYFEMCWLLFLRHNFYFESYISWFQVYFTFLYVSQLCGEMASVCRQVDIFRATTAIFYWSEQSQQSFLVHHTLCNQFHLRTANKLQQPLFNQLPEVARGSPIGLCA